MIDEPPAIQRIAEAPMHSSPYKDPPKLRARGSGLARPATTFHVGPTDSNYIDEDDQALHASNGRGHPANLASSRSHRSSYPSPGQPPWKRKGSWQVARTVQ